MIFRENIEDTLKEWSRVLMHKYGKTFRVYPTQEETFQIWSKELAKVYGRLFLIKENYYSTLIEWNRIIGG